MLASCCPGSSISSCANREVGGNVEGGGEPHSQTVSGGLGRPTPSGSQSHRCGGRASWPRGLT